MYWSIIQFISVLCTFQLFKKINGDTDQEFPVFFRSLQNTNHGQKTEVRFNDDEDDPDEGSFCPPTHFGEIARQPWDVKGALSVSLVLSTPKPEKSTEKSPSTDCDDNDGSASLIIKVLFDHDDLCAKNRIKTRIIKPMDESSLSKENENKKSTKIFDVFE